MNPVLKDALNLLDIIENNRSDLRAELSEPEWQNLIQRVNSAQQSLEDMRDRLESKKATESDLTMTANKVIEELEQSEAVRKLSKSLQRDAASESTRSYIIAGLNREPQDRPTSSSEELVAFTNRMIKRCEIIRASR